MKEDSDLIDDFMDKAQSAQEVCNVMILAKLTELTSYVKIIADAILEEDEDDAA